MRKAAEERGDGRVGASTHTCTRTLCGMRAPIGATLAGACADMCIALLFRNADDMYKHSCQPTYLSRQSKLSLAHRHNSVNHSPSHVGKLSCSSHYRKHLSRDSSSLKINVYCKKMFAFFHCELSKAGNSC